MNDTRKIALVLAITMALAQVISIWDAVLALSQMANLRWLHVVPMVAHTAAFLTFVVLLVILYWVNPSLAIAKNLRYVALAMALVYGLVTAAPMLMSWIRLTVGYWREMQWAEGTVLAEKFWNWVTVSNARNWMLSGAHGITGVAFVLFLVSLYRYKTRPPARAPGHTYLLREAAALATIVGIIMWVANAGGRVSAVIQYCGLHGGADAERMGGPTLTGLLVRSGLSLLSDMTDAVTAYVLYRSVPSAGPADATASE